MRKYSKIYFIVIVMPVAAMANSFFESKKWHQVIGAQAGIAILGNANQSQVFPIQSIGQDEFYVYSAQQTKQVPAIYGGFIGTEWQGASNSNI